MVAISVAAPERTALTGHEGFTLIEALVAFAVLAIGVTGIIGLLVLSKASQHQSLQRSTAVTLADSIVERIRSNPAGLASYNLGNSTLGGGSISNEPSPNCSSGVCTPTQLASHDLWAWEQALDGASVKAGSDNTAGLIEPRGCITFSALGGYSRSGELNVTIQWRGLSETSDAVQSGEATCGGSSAGTDDFRRQVVVNTLIVDETEL
ncbi:MAG: type IV pilus modification protein PilV [Pseudomonadota bacterium]